MRRHQRIDHRRRFVVENRFRVLRQRARDGHRALHPRAEFRRQLVGDFADLEHFGQFRDARLLLLLAEIRPLFQRKRNIFPHRQRIKQRARLENHRNPPADFGQLVFVPVGDVLARNQHAPRVRPQESKNMLQRYGLAHTAAPHDHARFCIVDEEADVVEHQMIVKGFADVVEFDEMASRCRPRLSKYSCAHAGPLLLMSPRAEANQKLSGTCFSLCGFDFCWAQAPQAEACATLPDH